jgi:transposase
VINERPMKTVGVSRRALFEQLDRPALKPLPVVRYELAEWKACRVNIDYHVEIAHAFYSVPYQLVHEQVDTRATTSTIEVFFKGGRVALACPAVRARSLCHLRRAYAARAPRACRMDPVCGEFPIVAAKTPGVAVIPAESLCPPGFTQPLSARRAFNRSTLRGFRTF